jgi:hypothetical protein
VGHHLWASSEHIVAVVSRGEIVPARRTESAMSASSANTPPPRAPRC